MRNPYIPRSSCLQILINDMEYQKELLENKYRCRRMANLDPTEIEVYLDNMNWLRIKISLYEARLRNEERCNLSKLQEGKSESIKYV